MANLLGKGGLQEVICDLSWEENIGPEDHDLDLVALVCRRGVLLDASDVISGTSEMHPDDAIQHTGDDTSGASNREDDTVGDEQLQMNLTRVEANIDRIGLAVVINSDKLIFDAIRKATFRMYVPGSDKMLHKYDLTQMSPFDSAMVVHELVRRDGIWQQEAVTFGTDAGINGIANYYGFDTEE